MKPPELKVELPMEGNGNGGAVGVVMEGNVDWQGGEEPYNTVPLKHMDATQEYAASSLPEL